MPSWCISVAAKPTFIDCHELWLQRKRSGRPLREPLKEATQWACEENHDLIFHMFIIDTMTIMALHVVYC